MILTGQVRLGRDAEVRYTEGGNAVATLNVVYSHSRKEQGGERPSQWIEAALWGRQAEALSQWLTKGSAWFMTLSDVHVSTYPKKDGSQGHKLVGRVINIEFGATNRTDNQQQASQPKPQQQSQPAQQRAANPYQAPVDNLADMDDIPW